jgi:hypothetical protein
VKSVKASIRTRDFQQENEMPRIDQKSSRSSSQPDSAHGGNGAGAGGNGYRLHKEHAVVHTATIDVKIIRLDRRQLTLSVFRQLSEKSIFDDPDGEVSRRLQGVPWGTVNYTWGGSPGWADYYLVWQDGDLLRRMPLTRLDNLSEPCKVRCLDHYASLSTRTTQKGRELLLYLGIPTDWLYQKELQGEPRKALDVYCGHLETFEQLDQLFIAC